MYAAHAMTRRSFVAGVGTAVAAGAVAGVAGQARAAEAQAAEFDESHDVVVIGYGLAGASAAVYAADAGADVLLVEAAPEGHEGGNSRYCGQLCLYTKDEQGLLGYLRNLASGHDMDDEVLQAYAAGIADVADVFHHFGIDEPLVWSDYIANNEEEAQQTHVLGARKSAFPEWREVEGSDAVDVMTVHADVSDGAPYAAAQEAVAARDNITVWLESPAQRLVTDASGEVTGVVVSHEGAEVAVRASGGVVLACGGFECNRQMTQDYLGVSRSTLRYYEQVGIARPERDEHSNYRVYTVDDIYRIAGCFMLKSAGYAVQDAPALLGGMTSAEAFVDNLTRKNETEIAWHLAMRDALDRLRRVCSHPADDKPRPRLAYVEPWLAYYDKGETSYKNFSPDKTMAALLRDMPVTSFGSVFAGKLLESEGAHSYRSFRCVPRKYAHLIPELSSGERPADEAFGGCPCVVVTNRMRYEDIELFSSPAPYRDALRDFLEREGLVPEYPAFSINAWPTVDAIYCEINLPVRATNLRGAAAIRRAKSRASSL